MQNRPLRYLDRITDLPVRFQQICYKRSLFNAVLEGFYLFFFKIQKFRGSYEDKQYEQNNLEEKVSHNLQNLRCKISNFWL